MSSSELRYGVIGTGMMGREHIANISHLPGARITALTDPHPSSLDAAALLAPAAARFTNHRDLMDAGLCDAVVIATPNMTHAAVLDDVLGTDLHVLVEKPLCTNVADCQRVLKAADDHRGLVWVGLEYRYMAPFARLIDEVNAGTAGRVRMVSLREHRFPFLEKVGGLEPVREQHRRHARGEVLPLLRPHEPGACRDVPSGSTPRAARW